ncbi:MAG: hypothetical protein SGJ10_12405 [Bacteroidota bacterium]|nr:hypothetical protein [Bacteroidota bacterium]
MKKLLSVLMVASMVSFVACKGGKKNDDQAKHDADSIETARVQDSIKNAMATDTIAKHEEVKDSLKNEVKKEDKKIDEMKKEK